MAAFKIGTFVVLCIFMICGTVFLILGNGNKRLDIRESLQNKSIPHTGIVRDSAKLPEIQDFSSKTKLKIHNITAGHKSLPKDKVLFESAAYNLGMTEPWVTRLRTLQEVCRSDKSVLENSRSSGNRFLFSKKSAFVFCKVPKTGCTFLTSLYGILELGLKPEKVFGRNRDSIHMRTFGKLSSNLPNPSDGRFTKIVIARDPYKRLFSAYIDKVYLFGFPWLTSRVASKSGMATYRTRNLECGYTTSFQNFLEIFMTKAVETGSANPHWKAVSDMCNVCNIDYQLVLTTETLSKDTEYIIDHFNIEEQLKQSIKQTLHNGNAFDEMIKGLIESYMRYQKAKKSNCPSTIAYLYKLWKAFKTLGYIKNTVTFPWTKFQNLGDINAKAVSEIVLDTIRNNPLSTSEKAKQKHDALVDAYRHIKPSTIDKIKTYYKHDFKLFGYDARPPFER